MDEKFGSFYKYFTIFSNSEFVGIGEHEMVRALITKLFTNLKKLDNCSINIKNIWISQTCSYSRWKFKIIINEITERVIKEIHIERKINVL